MTDSVCFPCASGRITHCVNLELLLFPGFFFLSSKAYLEYQRLVLSPTLLIKTSVYSVQCDVMWCLDVCLLVFGLKYFCNLQ